MVEARDFWELNNRLGDIEGVHNVLSKILIERVPQTPGHTLVREYIVDYMQNVGWTVEQDSFSDRTPLGQMNFTNIIARLNPNAERYLTIACHYDSKLMEGFVGATDSAVPCALMMNIAKSLQSYLREVENGALSIQYIFFDGEEAFLQWSSTDSIYGARHLAKKWEQENQLEKIVNIVGVDLLSLF